jgi:perosamine synthetase
MTDRPIPPPYSFRRIEIKDERKVDLHRGADVRRIPIAGPSIGPKEIAYVSEAVETGWYDRANEFLTRFEKAFASYVGVRHAVALPSCTSAIHLALAARRIGAGDEVIVPDLTWIASAAPVAYVGAAPMFADVDPATWCVTPESISQRLTPRTKAIIAVGLYGSMPPLEEIRRLADERGLFLIEDAAEALGSTLGDRRAGSFGHAGVFSFHGSKTLTTGEGGMLVTDDDALHRRVLFLRDHGRAPGEKMFWNAEVAFKYRMSGLQAALGLAQLERVEELVAKKREIFRWYQEALTDLPWITLNAEPDRVKNSYWMVTAIFPRRPENEKERIIRRLAERGIDSRPFFYPLSTIPAYEALPAAAAARRDHVVAHEVSRYGINLPCALRVERDDVATVVGALREVVAPPP